MAGRFIYVPIPTYDDVKDLFSFFGGARAEKKMKTKKMNAKDACDE